VGVFAENRAELVDGIIGRLQPCDPDKVVELQLEKENHTSNGEYLPRMPIVSSEESRINHSKCATGNQAHFLAPQPKIRIALPIGNFDQKRLGPIGKWTKIRREIRSGIEFDHKVDRK